MVLDLVEKWDKTRLFVPIQVDKPFVLESQFDCNIPLINSFRFPRPSDLREKVRHAITVPQHYLSSFLKPRPSIEIHK